MGDVDPAFRARVAAALQVSGMDVEANGDAEDDDEESDEEVWDDEQMLKVDEQLAAVFRDRAAAGSGKKVDKSESYLRDSGHEQSLTRNRPPDRIHPLQSPYTRPVRGIRQETTPKPSRHRAPPSLAQHYQELWQRRCRTFQQGIESHSIALRQTQRLAFWYRTLGR